MMAIDAKHMKGSSGTPTTESCVGKGKEWEERRVEKRKGVYGHSYSLKARLERDIGGQPGANIAKPT